MSTAWLESNDIALDVDGKIIMCEECPCLLDVGCCPDDPLPKTLTVTLTHYPPGLSATSFQVKSVPPDISPSAVWELANADPITIDCSGEDEGVLCEIACICSPCIWILVFRFSDPSNTTGCELVGSLGNVDLVSCDPFELTFDEDTELFCEYCEEANKFRLAGVITT